MDFTNKEELLEGLNNVFLAEDKDVALSDFISEIQHQIVEDGPKDDNILRLEINPNEMYAKATFRGALSIRDMMSMLMSLTQLTAQTIKKHINEMEINVNDVLGENNSTNEVPGLREFAEKMLKNKHEVFVADFLKNVKESFLKELEA